METIVWAVVALSIVGLVYRWAMASLAERANARVLAAKLLDRIASSDELIAFVRSSEGRALLSVPAGDARPDPRRSALRCIQGSIVAAAAGVALFVNASRTAAATDLNLVNEHRLIISWATAAIALAAALALNAAATYLLGKRWGLLAE